LKENQRELTHAGAFSSVQLGVSEKCRAKSRNQKNVDRPNKEEKKWKGPN